MRKHGVLYYSIRKFFYRFIYRGRFLFLSCRLSYKRPFYFLKPVKNNKDFGFGSLGLAGFSQMFYPGREGEQWGGFKKRINELTERFTSERKTEKMNKNNAKKNNSPTLGKPLKGV